MEELNNLFDDIREWNIQWKVFDAYFDVYKNTPKDKSKINMPSIPKCADSFVEELNKKYSVTFK